MHFSPMDYQHVMCIIQDLKQFKAEPVEVEVGKNLDPVHCICIQLEAVSLHSTI